MFSFKLLAIALAASSVAGKINEPKQRKLEPAEAGTPSAKFAASWEDDAVIAADCLNTDSTDGIWGDSYETFCNGLADSNEHEMVLAQSTPLGLLKIPNDKEILVTLSAQINIFTINTATSKKRTEDAYYGNIGATSAMAGVQVELVAIDSAGDETLCAPGSVTMASRYVELRNQIGANITYEDCYRNDDDVLVCETKIADSEIESSIGIAMNTTAAHSFQFVCVDMESDTYDLGARFTLDAETNDLCDDTSGGDCDTISDLAAARVILQKRILTAQQVRAVKGAIEF